MPTPISLFALLLPAGFILGCSNTSEADQILAMPEAVQVQAHVDCQATKGLYAPEAIHLSRLRGKRAMVLTVGSSSVPADLAQDINQCARAKLLSNRARSVIDVQPHRVVLVDKKTSLRSARRPSSAKFTPVGCSVGGGVLQRGKAICVGN